MACRVVRHLECRPGTNFELCGSLFICYIYCMLSSICQEHAVHDVLYLQINPYIRIMILLLCACASFQLSLLVLNHVIHVCAVADSALHIRCLTYPHVRVA